MSVELLMYNMNEKKHDFMCAAQQLAAFVIISCAGVHVPCVPSVGIIEGMREMNTI